MGNVINLMDALRRTVGAPLYHIFLVCPRCDRPGEIIAPIIPDPHVRCGDCLMNDVEIVEMKIVAAEQI